MCINDYCFCTKLSLPSSRHFRLLKFFNFKILLKDRYCTWLFCCKRRRARWRCHYRVRFQKSKKDKISKMRLRNNARSSCDGFWVFILCATRIQVFSKSVQCNRSRVCWWDFNVSIFSSLSINTFSIIALVIFFLFRKLDFLLKYQKYLKTWLLNFLVNH